MTWFMLNGKISKVCMRINGCKITYCLCKILNECVKSGERINGCFRKPCFKKTHNDQALLLYKENVGFTILLFHSFYLESLLFYIFLFGK